MTDRVDEIVRGWTERHPDLDFSPLEVVSRVLRCAHYLQAGLDEIAAAYGLSHTGDLDVLANLDRVGPPHVQTPSELAKTQLVTAGGMTVRLNRLERSGLIGRAPNPSDGRGVLVSLTSLGRELIEDALPNLIDVQEKAIDGLDVAERGALAQLLRDLLTALGDAPAFRPTVAAQRNSG